MPERNDASPESANTCVAWTGVTTWTPAVAHIQAQMPEPCIPASWCAAW